MAYVSEETAAFVVHDRNLKYVQVAYGRTAVSKSAVGASVLKAQAYSGQEWPGVLAAVSVSTDSSAAGASKQCPRMQGYSHFEQPHRWTVGMESLPIRCFL